MFDVGIEMFSAIAGEATEVVTDTTPRLEYMWGFISGVIATLALGVAADFATKRR